MHLRPDKDSRRRDDLKGDRAVGDWQIDFARPRALQSLVHMKQKVCVDAAPFRVVEVRGEGIVGADREGQKRPGQDGVFLVLRIPVAEANVEITGMRRSDFVVGKEESAVTEPEHERKEKNGEQCGRSPQILDCAC